LNLIQYFKRQEELLALNVIRGIKKMVSGILHEPELTNVLFVLSFIEKSEIFNLKETIMKQAAWIIIPSCLF
jgi:hypothetical protein